MVKADPEFAECRACSCSALRRAGRAVTQHYEARFRGSGMRGTQFTVLATLSQTGPITVSKLASFLGVERTTLTRNLRPLEKRGWVRRLSDESDARLRRFELTAKGRATAAKLLPLWRKAQAEVGPLLERLGVKLSPP
jgi:DNA-binding MarR family transcriptional regulator